MKPATILTAVLVCAPLAAPAPAAAQDCKQAIVAVEQTLQQVKKREDWNRVQVQLYIAEQSMQEGAPEFCMHAVEEARRIMAAALPASAQVEVPPPSGETDPARRRTDRQESGPAGANITGLDAEGWGTNEAQTSSISRDQAATMIGKPVESPTGERFGRIVDILGGADSQQRFVIEMGTRRVPVPADKIQYQEGQDAAIADMTREELENVLPLQGGTESGGQTAGSGQ